MNWVKLDKTKEVETRIKKILRFSSDSHDIFTPFALCDEIVSKIPSLNGNILVVANLEFLYTMKMHGVDTKHLYFATPCSTKASVAKSIIPASNIIIYNNIIAETDINMKFDVVVGNPPYQPANNENTKNIWPLFLELAFNITKKGGVISLITPRTWATNALYEKFFTKYDPIHINIDECAKYFPGVGSTFSYYIIVNQLNTNNPVTITSNNGDVTLKSIPTTGLGNPHPVALSILDKMITGVNKFSMITSSGYNTMKFSKDDSTVSREQTTQHPYKVLHKNKKGKDEWFYSSILDTKEHNVPRVIINIWVANYDKMLVSETLLTCEQYRHYPVNTIEEAIVLRSILLSPPYKFIAMSLVSGGSFTNKSLSKFPSVDLTRSWSDEELCAHFNLTLEEIKLIEDTIK